MALCQQLIDPTLDGFPGAQNVLDAGESARRLGGTVTVIYTAQSEAPQKHTRGAMLPFLVVLFVISYSILTLLVIEQGRTIDVQRGLLREMLKDSTQLAVLKGKLAREEAIRASEKAPARAEEKNSANAASPNATPKAPAKDKQPTKRTMKVVPEKPAADLQDVRRSTRVI